MKDRLISNTGPIIALSMIDRLDILRDLFEVVTIPETVHREILEGGTTCSGLEGYLNAKWIKVEKLLTPLDPLLLTTLDAGEAAVIGLSRQFNVNFVLIDERKARKIARTIYGLHVIGSARILVEAKKQGLIACVGAALQKMRDRGYWIGDAIVSAALQQAGEKQSFS
jgi:hypothetical protein